MAEQLGPQPLDRARALDRGEAVEHAAFAKGHFDRRAMHAHLVAGVDRDAVRQLDMRAQEFVAMFDLDPARPILPGLF